MFCTQKGHEARLVFVIICILSLPAVFAQSSVTQTGDIQIITENGVITCDTMTCPRGSERCIVTKVTSNDLLDIVRTRRCLDANGYIVKEQQVIYSNPNINQQISDYAEASVSGNNVYQCSNCDPEYFRQFGERNYNTHWQQANNFANSMNAFQQQMQSSMAQMQSQIQRQVGQQMQGIFGNAYRK